MPEITKETFLKAVDPKNRDAMLFDMLQGIDDKIHFCKKIDKRVSKVEIQLTYIKRIGAIISAGFSTLFGWMFKNS